MAQLLSDDEVFGTPPSTQQSPAPAGLLSDEDVFGTQSQPSNVAADVGKSIASSAAPASANVGAAMIPGVGQAMLLKGATDWGMQGAKALGETHPIVNAYAALTGQPSLSDKDWENYQKDLKNGTVKDTFNQDYLPARLSNALGYPSTWVHKAQDALGLDYKPQTQEGQVAGQTLEGASMLGKNAPAAVLPMLAGSTAGKVAENEGANPLEQWLASTAAGGAAAKGQGALAKLPSETPYSQMEDANTNALMRQKNPVPPLDPVDVIRSHGAAQLAASNVNGIIGDNLRTMAGDNVGYAPNARASIEALLDQAQNGTEPMKNRAQVVKALNHTLSQFDEDGNMPISAALDLNRMANENYKSGQNLYTGAWGDVRDAAQDVLSDHATSNPEFGQMLHLQRIHNANDVGEAYKNNDTLQKMFGVDDLKNVSDYDNGILRNVGTDTQKAANSIVTKIKTPEDYQAVARGIDDPQVLRQFNNAVVDNVLPSRLQHLWNAVKGGDKVARAQELVRVIHPSIGLSSAEKGILSAVKANEVTPTRDYTGQTAEKANSIMSDWQNRMQSIPPDAPPVTNRLALPKPAINVPAAGFGQVPQEPDINYSPSQRALPAPREFTAEEMANRYGLPPPESVAIGLPEGQPARTYNPNDLNRGDEPSVPFKGNAEPTPEQLKGNAQVQNAKNAPIGNPATFTTSLKNPQNVLVNVRQNAIKWGINPGRIVVRNGQLTIKNPSPDESAKMQSLVDAEHTKAANRAAGADNRRMPVANNFFQEIKNAGGIQPSGETRQLGMHNTPGLINKNGLTHEEALNLGIENGWIPDKGTNSDLESQNDLNDLYSALERGKSPRAESEPAQGDYRENLEEEADKRGIAHQGMTNSQLVRELTLHDQRNIVKGHHIDNLIDDPKTPISKELPYAHETGTYETDKKVPRSVIQGNERPAPTAKNTGVGAKTLGSNTQSHRLPPEDEIPFRKGGRVK